MIQLPIQLIVIIICIPQCLAFTTCIFLYSSLVLFVWFFVLPISLITFHLGVLAQGHWSHQARYWCFFREETLLPLQSTVLVFKVWEFWIWIIGLLFMFVWSFDAFNSVWRVVCWWWSLPLCRSFICALTSSFINLSSISTNCLKDAPPSPVKSSFLFSRASFSMIFIKAVLIWLYL